MSHRGTVRSARNKPSVIGVGLVALDVVITEDSGGTPRYVAGGTCGNVLAGLSYQGWKAFPIARLNGDNASILVQRDLKKWGVRLRFASLAPKTKTPVVVHRIRRSADGTAVHRFSWRCPGCGRHLPSYRAVVASAVEQIVNGLATPTVVFIDRPSCGAVLLAKAAAKQGAIVFFEPSAGGSPNHFQEILSVAHVLKYSTDFSERIRPFLAESKALLEIETLGAAGLRYRMRMSRPEVTHWDQVEALDPGRVIDRGGAGDWCSVGIIERLCASGLDALRNFTQHKIRDGLRFGQALAAWTCAFEGARGGMYSIDKKSFRSQIDKILTGQHFEFDQFQKRRAAHKLFRPKICGACGYSRTAAPAVAN